MTTDKIEVKEDTGDTMRADRTPKVNEQEDKVRDARQPLQPQQRVERENPGPDVTTPDDVGLPVGNKSESPGNGG